MLYKFPTSLNEVTFSTQFSWSLSLIIYHLLLLSCSHQCLEGTGRKCKKEDIVANTLAWATNLTWFLFFFFWEYLIFSYSTAFTQKQFGFSESFSVFSKNQIQKDVSGNKPFSHWAYFLSQWALSSSTTLIPYFEK